MSQSVFTLNLERCTGCAACAIACTNENDVGDGLAWRQIATFNEERLPGTGVFHYSLACNHCAEPACMYGCPARAYTKDATTGAVLLDQDRCIGCGYCAWVCPYDAPQYDKAAGVMEKCTFCSHRLADGREPACVEACPVEALGFEPSGEPGTPGAPGFPDTGLRPGIRIEAGRYGAPAARPRRRQPRLESRRLAGEWPLAVFSIAVTWMVALFAALWISGGTPPRFAFPLAGAFAMTISTLHLGRPLRAWRAFAGLGTSWVSREVFCFTLFWPAAAATFLASSVPAVAGWLTLLAGLATLVAMDMVYRVPGQRVPAVPHSAMTMLTAVFLLGLLLRQPFVAGGAAALKLALWPWAGLPRGLTVARMAAGFAWPLVVWLARPDASAVLLLAGPAIGEALDRLRFYAEFEFLTPRIQIQRDLPA